MILGKIWKAIAAQFNKLANAIRGVDPIAEMQYEYDRSVEQLKDGREGLAQYRALVERVLRQVDGQKKQVAMHEAKIKAYLRPAGAFAPGYGLKSGRRAETAPRAELSRTMVAISCGTPFSPEGCARRGNSRGAPGSSPGESSPSGCGASEEFMEGGISAARKAGTARSAPDEPDGTRLTMFNPGTGRSIASPPDGKSPVSRLVLALQRMVAWVKVNRRGRWRRQLAAKPCWCYSNPRDAPPAQLLPPFFGALNSAVECHLHTVEVAGSNPAAPTIKSIIYGPNSRKIQPTFQPTATAPQ